MTAEPDSPGLHVPTAGQPSPGAAGSEEPPPIASELSALALPQIFSPGEAADVLRGLGLTGMSECALRTRAYRKQVPFHTNGRRIVFTLDDLREIAEGQSHRPAPREAKNADHSQRKPPPMVRRSLPRHRDHPHADPWRAHIPHDRRTGHRDNDTGHPPAAQKATRQDQ